MDFYIAQFLTGLAGASSLFLVASGLSIIFGVTRIVNFAHGAFYMLGAYVAYTLTERFSGAFGFWGSIVRAALLGKAQQQIYAGREDQNIHYLLGRLCLRVGDFATARIHLTNASIQPQARARIEEELLSLLPQTNAVSPGITSRPTPQSSPNTAYKSPSE